MPEGSISKAQYCDLVRLSAPPTAELADQLEELLGVLGAQDAEERLRAIAEDFLVDVDAGYEGIALIFPLSCARGVLNASGFTVFNWHYDRKTGCLIVNLRRGVHEHLSALLHQIYVGSEIRTDAAAECFIEEGLGWFKSSSSNGRMLKGNQVRFSAQERTVFGTIPAFE